MTREASSSSPSAADGFREAYAPDHPNFRRALCRHWLRGRCARGAMCNFAHGNEELRRGDQPAAMVERLERGTPTSPARRSETVELYEQLASDYVLVDGEEEGC